MADGRRDKSFPPLSPRIDCDGTETLKATWMIDRESGANGMQSRLESYHTRRMKNRGGEASLHRSFRRIHSDAMQKREVSLESTREECREWHVK